MPWSRLPRSVQVVLPVACFVVVALLTKAGGGASSGYAPLVIVPVFWLALYGTGRELAVALVGVALTFAVPVALVGRPSTPRGNGSAWSSGSSPPGSSAGPCSGWCARCGNVRTRARR